MNLQELTAGKKIKGLLSEQVAEIIAVNFYGDAAEVFYKDEHGNFGNKLIYADQISELTLAENLSLWQFDSDSKIFRLVSEAYRISVAHLVEPYLAIYSSLIEPLPHQISAVYEKMLVMQPLRFVLADDPGAGKTVMTGLLIKELILRGDVRRCLIVCPGTLAEQWQEELQQKFHLKFEILTSDRINQVGNVFSEVNRAIVSIDTLARNGDFQDKLHAKDWDLIVCDEAHKMSATVWSNEVKYTKRFHLGQLLGKITRHFLLLTATPHNGKEKDFQLFMSLIDPDRFEGAQRIKNSVDVSDIMRRLLKEDLLTFEGKPLFPERRAYTVNYSLSPEEMQLYELVTAYVSDGFNRAEKLSGGKKNSVGFAMTILQRRLASSPKAIYKSLERRTERLQKILREKNFVPDEEKSFDDEELSNHEEFPDGEFENKEDELSERVTAAQTFAELKKEIQTLKLLTEKAKQVFLNGDDKKWRELSELLQDDKKFSKGNGEREKLIIFTEHRDTLDYLQEKISSLFGQNEIVVTIHGGFNHRERHKIEEQFRQDKKVSILIATDAAGEGINLQNAHLMINYDLPWNPNRLEQRFGRIHRIGQKEVCHLWNLVANETREGQVFQRLLKKLEQERAALGGKVFDILGKISFDNKPLRELLLEAVRYGNDPETVRKLDEVVDKSFDPNKIRELIRQRALTNDVLDFDKIADMNQNMERVDAHKLQPYFIEKFFDEAFKKLGGQIFSRGSGRYEIIRVPKDIRTHALQNNFGEPVAESYKRICFEKKFCNIAGVVPAVLIAPGNPLLESVSSLILKRFGNVLRQGTVFIDDTAEKNFRLLFYIETKILNDKSEIISRRLHFVEISEDGQAVLLNRAPYFDYDSPKDPDTLKKILSAAQNMQWLKSNVEKLAINYAIKNLVPPHRQEIAAKRKAYLDKLEREVKTRLNGEIRYLDRYAADLRDKDKLNSDKAYRRAGELAERLNRRIAEIKLEREISTPAPVIVGGALIVPKNFLQDSEQDNFSADALARSRVEKIAMNAVMSIEREFGFEPVDVSANKCGYDIEARDKNFVRFIEVKGRIADATEVTVTKNEIITALNAPDNFILAIVTVDADNAHVVYLKSPFSRSPDFYSVNVTYPIAALKQQGKILLDRKTSVKIESTTT